ncbi:uncharacterized protein CTRU02_212304 [Colletotrichum truncatum]|uniref:Uncharacterized protein n=1 Tax=Colletotrichum truncatum TaxID=5467 RepID=A0ACC3YN88_COLTU
MKTTSTLSLLCIAALLFQSFAAAWQLPSFQVPRIPFWADSPAPNVPDFVVQANHPWYAAHADELSKLDDPTSFLCSLADEAVGDDRAPPDHDLVIPHDFFHRLVIDTCRLRSGAENWHDVRNRLLEMKGCPRAVAQVRELEVDVKHSIDPALPPSGLASVFADVMGSMKGLRKLYWNVPGWEENQVFKEGFARTGTHLASLKELSANPPAFWLVDAAPGLYMIEASNGEPRVITEGNTGWIVDCVVQWMDTALCLEKVTRLHLGRTNWNRTMHELIPKVFPNVEELWNMTIAFASLPKLKILHLPWSGLLNLGFHPPNPWEHTYDMGYRGRLSRDDLLADAAASELAGQLVREEMPWVKSVYIGTHLGNFTVDADGKEAITWPWTGRMDEWLREEDWLLVAM